MNRSLARAAPMRFLIGVTLAWTVGRGVALAGWRPGAPSTSPAVSAPASLPRTAPMAGPWTAAARPVRAISIAFTPRRDERRDTPFVRGPQFAGPSRERFDAPRATSPALMLAAYRVAPARTYIRSDGLVPARSIAATVAAKPRFTGSAWAFLRGGGRASALSPVGQIGGGQMGARLLYRVDRAERLAVAARVSRTIGGIRQTEAAVGLDWKPLDALPVHLTLDRRIAIDRGGRDAWALGTAGGVDDIRVARGWRLDAYGEAGVVGANRRDLYADGAARIARAIALGSGHSLAIGGGLWGAAQPHAARIDVGPSVVLRMPVAGRFLAVALDWRDRVAGHAKPGSGVALTVATDF